jgi:glyoxylase-like metal-dependent hydrolase (beta-lactamase superfamily II)
MKRFGLTAVLLALVAWVPRAWALEVAFVAVAPGVYAYVGDTGPRTLENEGLNANIGLIVTVEGAILVDSGATWLGARAIHDAVKRITPLPVRWVVNTGGQDHRWLGNGYFQAQGAEIIGHRRAAEDMQARGGDQMSALRAIVKERFEGTVAVAPTRAVDGERTTLRLGGTAVELLYRGGAHTPGDIVVWLPRQRVLFAGDNVYVDRMLAILPISKTKAWLASFEAVESLDPSVLVPGHGAVTDLAKARAQTRDYLLALRAHMKAAQDKGIELEKAVATFDGRAFAGLRNAEELMKANANRVYLEMEWE